MARLEAFPLANRSPETDGGRGRGTESGALRERATGSRFKAFRGALSRRELGCACLPPRDPRS